jgi:flagellar L-ring protein precursor FlgH
MRKFLGPSVTRLASGALCLALCGAPVLATDKDKAEDKAEHKAERAPKPSDNYDELFQRYLKAAREMPPTAAAPDSQWMTGLFADLRARRVNDLVTVRVIENVAAAGAADSSLDKESSASADISNIFGMDVDRTMAGLSANTGFKGSGQTTRTGQLTAVVTARVVEVLPNGDLGLEGVREIDINGDRQIIVLTGVVRTADIGAGNVVPSTAIGQMRIRYFGRGLIKDNLRPGWLVRVLNKVF